VMPYGCRLQRQKLRAGSGYSVPGSQRSPDCGDGVAASSDYGIRAALRAGDDLLVEVNLNSRAVISMQGDDLRRGVIRCVVAADVTECRRGDQQQKESEAAHQRTFPWRNA